MKKSILRKLLYYCPEPTESLIKTLKRYSVPTAVAITVSIILASFFLLVQTALSQSTLLPPPPLVTTEYNPGVSVGDYVVYGNFVCNREHPKGTTCINDLAFKKMEVIVVSGKEVTFLHTQQFKNGSATWLDGRTETWDVEKAQWSEDTDVWTDSSLIIAANLTEGDCIQSEAAPLPSFYVAETKVRSYLGVGRNVSILRNNDWVNIDGELCEIKSNVVYDQISGVRLESELLTLAGDLTASMSIIDTNIFSTSTPSPKSSLQGNAVASTPNVIFSGAIVSVFIIVVMVTGVVFRKRWKGGEKCIG